MENQDILNPDEVLLWVGKESVSVKLKGADLLMIPLSFGFLIFSLFWFRTSIAIVKDNIESSYNTLILLLPLLGIFLVILSLYFAVGRFIVLYFFRKNADYVISNQKITARYHGHVLYEMTYQDINLFITLNRKGTGNIYLRKPDIRQLFYGDTGIDLLFRRMRTFPVFYNVEQVECIKKIITEFME